MSDFAGIATTLAVLQEQLAELDLQLTTVEGVLVLSPVTAGGSIAINGGDGADIAGGNVSVNGGNANGSGASQGGIINITSGAGNNDDGSGGDVVITASTGSGDGNSGTVYIILDNGNNATPGNWVAMGLPTSDPGGSNRIWKNGNVLNIT